MVIGFYPICGARLSKLLVSCDGPYGLEHLLKWTTCISRPEMAATSPPFSADARSSSEIEVAPTR